MIETFGFPHYTAPVAGIVYLVVVQSFRCVASLEIGAWRIGRRLAPAWLTAALLSPSLSLLPQLHKTDVPWSTMRADVERDLHNREGSHLLVVRYGRHHRVHDEWVYNEADIEAARIIWAREMGQAGLDRLIEHFQDRTIWILEEDGGVPELRLLKRPETSTN
jgi:hypothetical protein